MRAKISPNGPGGTYQFEYGTTTAYGATAPIGGDTTNTGTEIAEVGEIASSLQSNTTYHYRVVVSSPAGSAVGADSTFTTGEGSSGEEEWFHNKGTGTEGVFTSGLGGGGGVGEGEPVGPGFINLMWGARHEDEGPEMEAIQHEGAKWLRLQVQAEGEVPKVNGAGVTENVPWPVFDERVFERAAKHGITILPLLGAGPGGSERFPTESSFQAYDEWVEGVVRKYGPTGTFWTGKAQKFPVTYFEVWNEPNVGSNDPDGSTVDPVAYGKFLESVSAAIANASGGKAKIVMGALLSVKKTAASPGQPEEISPEEFLQKMGAFGKNSYDAMGLHPYVFKAKPKSPTAPKETEEVKEVTSRVKNQVTMARNALKGVGNGDKPIWITEIGWPIKGVEDPIHAGIECTATVHCQQIQGELINYTFDMLKEQAPVGKLNIASVFYFNDRDVASDNTSIPIEQRTSKADGLWWFTTGLREFSESQQSKFRKAVYAFEAEAGVPSWPHKASTQTQGATPQLHSVSMFGRVNPDGLPAKLFFRYGTTSGYGKSTTPRDAGYEQEVELHEEATGLQQGTTYHYQAVSINENSEEEVGQDRTFTTPPLPTETFLTLDGTANGTPGTASVSGNVKRNGVGISGTVNVNFQKLVGGTWTTMSTAQRTLSTGHYEVVKWGVGVGQWRVRAVFPEQGEYAQSESDYHEFSIQPVPTETFLTLDGTANGTPGTASVSGNVQHNGAGISGTVNVNFQKLVGGTWTTMSTAQRTLSNGHYEVVKWGVGVGQWRVRAVFPEQGDYAQSESSYHEFSIQPVPTETFLTVDGTANGAPGSASVSGNVLHNGVAVVGTVNVNFEKWNGSAWQTMSSAQRVLSNGHYEVAGWGVGVGSWRVRAVFPEQGDYAQSESAYHEFSISPVPTEAFLTVDQVVKGKPGNVSVSGNVLHNGQGVPGYVNVNFEKWNGSAWQTMSTAQPGLSNGHYVVSNWGVGAGSWRVRVVFPEQGEYLGSISGYHEFTI